MGGLTQGSRLRTLVYIIKSELILQIKRPVSIKRPGFIFHEKSLLNVPYNLTIFFLKPLTSGTYNRDFRVHRVREGRVDNGPLHIGE